MEQKNKEIISLLSTEAILFFFTLALGIFTAQKLRKILKPQVIEIPSVSFFDFIFYFLLATFSIFLISRFIKKGVVKEKIYKTLFIFTSFFGSLILFEAFFSEPFSLFLVFLLALWWIKKPVVLNQNLLIIFSIAGIGATLGLALKPEMMVLILLVLSVYDFIAVYKTKHMVTMAKDMIESGTILGLVFPASFSGFLKNLTEVKPGQGEFLILGGGDVAFPLIFSVSLLEFGILKSFLVALFSLLGLFTNFFFFLKQKERKPIPALPLIAFFSVIGYSVSFLLK
jgi:presenilin-like A22 family membrane protease